MSLKYLKLDDEFLPKTVLKKNERLMSLNENWLYGPSKDFSRTTQQGTSYSKVTMDFCIKGRGFTLKWKSFRISLASRR